MLLTQFLNTYFQTNKIYSENTDRLSCIAMYSEPYRFYHNLSHVETILNLINQEASLSEEEKLILNVVAFFHDIYYSNQGNNEEKSKEVFYSYIPLTIRYLDSLTEIEKAIQQIASIIMATASHKEQQEIDLLSQYFLDYDLYVFTDTYNFITNMQKIGYENMSLYNLTEDRAKYYQKEYYKPILARKNIYYKHPEWEQEARQNLTNYIFR